MMIKNKGIKATRPLIGLLFCMILIQTAFATANVTTNNMSVENLNDMNIPMENATTDYIITGNTTSQVNPIYNQIDPNSDYRSILAGNRDSFTVSFTNKGNETLVLTPKLVTAPNSENNINESWINISPTNATVAPGAVQKFDIEENVSKDTESGEYRGQIAFTDDLLPNSTDYVNSMQLYTSVQAQPKIELQTNSIFDNVKVGKEYKYKINIKNVAGKDITVDPKLINSNLGYQQASQAFDNDAIKISAPSTIKAGEVTNMTICVQVPENATGSYNGNIDMHVNGEENLGINPQINLYFSLWQQPTVPYVKTFSTTTSTPITIEVTTSNYNSNMGGIRISPKDKEPSFDIELTHNSRPINMTHVKSVISGSPSFVGSNPMWANDNENSYQDYPSYVETYKVPGAIGNWQLNILPKNTNSVAYSITIGDSNSTTIGSTTIDDTTEVNESTDNTITK
jgi:hypothetical protein